MAWTTRNRVRHILIEPGKPMQNGYLDNCSGWFRTECLNEQWLQALQLARTAIAELPP